MISKAHLHIIPSFNATGIKLKLVNALFNGRHCVVNESTVLGTGLESGCAIATDATNFKQKINEFFQKPFTEDDVKRRHQLLDTMFDNDANALVIVKQIWSNED